MSDPTSSTQTSRVLRLAQIIASQTAIIHTHLRDNNLPEPSFDADAPIEPIQKATPDVEKAKISVIEAAIELRQLFEGPVKALLPEVYEIHLWHAVVRMLIVIQSNFAPLAAIYRFKIASFVPTQGYISFAELANKCELRESDVKRIIRFSAIHHRVFQEAKPGFVAHTAASKLLSENDKVGDVMGLTFAECWPAHSRAVDAIAEKSEEPNMTGYALANGTTLNTFDFLNKNPERAKRFAGAMSSTSRASLDALAEYFDWASLPAGSTVVDIGGSRGHVSLHLAERFQQVKFVVQDLHEVVVGAEESLSEDVADRLSFMGHDMFTEQPIRNAEVYLLRFVLHDWPDKHCVNALKQLVPAMKQGARVVIQDHILPEPGSLGLLQEMQIRYAYYSKLLDTNTDSALGLWMLSCFLYSILENARSQIGRQCSRALITDSRASKLSGSEQIHQQE